MHNCRTCGVEINALRTLFSDYCEKCSDIEDIVCGMINGELDSFSGSPKDYFESLGWIPVSKETLDRLARDTDFDSLDTGSIVDTVRENIQKGKYETTTDIVLDDEIIELVNGFVAKRIIEVRGE